MPAIFDLMFVDRNPNYVDGFYIPNISALLQGYGFGTPNDAPDARFFRGQGLHG